MDCGFSESVDTSCPGDFECNICFELAQEPIVTLCGHLYCWPCLYQWLNLHSQCHECPVCKALIQDDKLVPLYGRGKTRSDQRTRSVPGTPDRPAGQRPPTVTPPEINYFRQPEFGPPISPGRFGGLTLSALFGMIPSSLNPNVHGFHDATTVYGATTGAPYLFSSSSSFHGGYAHGFHHQYSTNGHGTRSIMKLFSLILGVLVIIHLIYGA